MKRKHRVVFLSLLLFMASTLISHSVVYAQESVATAPPATQADADVIQLRPDDVTAIIASRGKLIGNAKRHSRSGNVVHGFESPQDTVTWTVVAPKEGRLRGRHSFQ